MGSMVLQIQLGDLKLKIFAFFDATEEGRDLTHNSLHGLAGEKRVFSQQDLA